MPGSNGGPIRRWARSASTVNQSVGSGTTNQAVTAKLTGLIAGTAVLLPGGGFQLRGDVDGIDLSFSTPVPLPLPTVATNPATSVTTTGGTLNGSVNPNGLATNGWFEWGTDPATGHLQQHTQPVPGIRDDEPGGRGDAVGAYCRDDVLLPCGGLQLRGAVEGVDRQFQHYGSGSGADGGDEPGHVGDHDGRGARTGA